jgi:predicted ribosomally synthesized peptide with nif11-like leader
MSKQAAIDFLSKVDSDPTLSQQVLRSVDEVVKIAASNGYNFSKDDLKQAMAEKWATTPHGRNARADYCTLKE